MSWKHWLRGSRTDGSRQTRPFDLSESLGEPLRNAPARLLRLENAQRHFEHDRERNQTIQFLTDCLYEDSRNRKKAGREHWMLSAPSRELPP